MMITELTGWRVDVGRRVYVVQLQRHAEGDTWKPETDLVEIAANVHGDTARQVGLDFALDRLPEGDDWQVLVWEPAMVGQSPAARISPADTQGNSHQPKHVIRSGKKRPQPRLRGPVSQVVAKARPSDALLGKPILMSADRTNRVGETNEGGWHVANFPAPGTERASVRGFSRQEVRGVVTYLLVTSLGTVVLPETGSVIPA
jgi:hypothetical protein